MKSNNKYIVKALMAFGLVAGMSSCEDFLNREPMSTISPEAYFSSAAQLEANLNDEYPNVLPAYGGWDYGIFGEDKGTDNQVEANANDRYTLDRWRVPHEESDNWKFERIYRINFFLSQALPKFGTDISGAQNTISGDVSSVKHYIGEMYFLRAYEYFKILWEEIERGGDIFSPILSAGNNGNVFCDSDPDELIIGFVEVASTTRKSLFIPYDDFLYEPASYLDCWLSNTNTLPIGKAWYRYPEVAANPRCVDCRAKPGATKNRPAWWPNEHY